MFDEPFVVVFICRSKAIAGKTRDQMHDTMKDLGITGIQISRHRHLLCCSADYTKMSEFSLVAMRCAVDYDPHLRILGRGDRDLETYSFLSTEDAERARRILLAAREQVNGDNTRISIKRHGVIVTVIYTPEAVMIGCQRLNRALGDARIGYLNRKTGVRCMGL